MLGSQARGRLGLCGRLEQGPWLGELTWLVSSPWSASASAFQSETLSQSVVPAMCQGRVPSSGDKAAEQDSGSSSWRESQLHGRQTLNRSHKALH